MATTVRVVSAASTNATVIKAAPGRIRGWVMTNGHTVVQFVRLYNIASAPTVGTTPVVMTIALGPGQVCVAQFPPSDDLFFGTGIGLSITALGADSDATVATVSVVHVNLFVV